MTHASRWLRRVEIALWVIGVALLGVALAATVPRWKYQAEQERALARTVSTSQLAPREIVSHPRSIEIPTNPLPADEASAPETAEPSEPANSDELPSEPEPSPEISEGTAEGLESQAALDPDLLGRIEIPRLGLSAIVREGDDESTLRRAVGHIPGTSPPGAGGNTALAGHRDTFFRPLRRIEVDDRIRLVVPPNTYEYRVDSLRVVESDEVSVLESNGTEELTLLTCYPFRFIGPAPDRFVVKATRIR